MSSIREYILTVTSATIICGALRALLPDQFSAGKILKIITGVFMTIVIISPMVKLKISGLGSYLQDFQMTSAEISEKGQEMAIESMSEIIKVNTEAYILKEATRLGISLDVNVTTTDSNPPVPNGVVLTGNISPYQKRMITVLIEEELNIPKESQQWN